MSRRRGLFEVVIGLVIIVLSIPIIMMSLTYSQVTGEVTGGLGPFYPIGPELKPNIPELITGSIGVFIGIVLIVDGLRRSIPRGRSIDLPKRLKYNWAM